MNKLTNILFLIRPHYWSKNIIMYIPFFANKNESLAIFSNLFIGFIIFSLVSSIGYIFNDIIDLENDKKHLYKKRRPIANGSISVNQAYIIIFLLIVIILSLVYFFSNFYFNTIIFLYLFGTLTYSLVIKKFYLLDVIAISVFFMLRIESGSAIINVDTSFWLISYSLLFFLSLSFLKRIAEIVGYNESDKNSFLRNNYQGNKLHSLVILSLICNTLSSIILYFYISSEKVSSLYNNYIFLYLAIPILALWYGALLFRIIKNKIDIDPIIFTLKDKLSYFFLFLIIFIVKISS